MPEGDTIYKIAHELGRQLVGKRVKTRIRKSGIEFSATVSSVKSHGKNLFIEFDDGRALRSHLGMSGSWHSYLFGSDSRRRGFASIEIMTDRRVFLCYRALEVEILRAFGFRRKTLAQRMGPDLLAAEFDGDRIVSRAREFLSGETRLVDVLLDQRPAAGIGNVYKSETLFVGGESPHAPLGHLDDGRLRALYEIARRLMLRNLGEGPRATREGVRPGESDLWVYGRRELPCLRCRRRIRYERLGKDLRSTYYCPTCQLAP